MRSIRKMNTRPERALRHALRSAGVRHRTYADLPGTPDIIVPASKVAVFVHGCFWHACPKHYRPAKTRTEYWLPKIARNKARDARNARALRRLGWAVLTIWECQALEAPDAAAARVARAAQRRAARNS
jgi:DNA mismatch endonuclease (patch repair protein)